MSTDKHNEDDLYVIDAAKIELDVMDVLIVGARAKERELAGRDFPDVVVPDVRDRARLPGQDFIDAYGELASRGFGKVVTVLTEDGERRSYRVAQANVTMVDSDGQHINVINRLAPVSQLLVPTQVGDEFELPQVGHVEVVEVELLSGWQERQRDIRALNCQWLSPEDRERRGQIENCRESVEIFERDATVATVREYKIRPVHDGHSFLGHEFYTQTSADQERLIREQGRGVVWVEGVAGSGKTSVGLGLLKALHDRRLFGKEEEGHDVFFSEQSNMLAVVISGQLVGYLQQTCRQLNLGNVPVREYGEIRRELMRRFRGVLGLSTEGGLGKRYEQDLSITSRPTMQVIRDVDHKLFDNWIDDVEQRLDELLAQPMSSFPSLMVSVGKEQKTRVDLNKLVTAWLQNWAQQFLGSLRKIQREGRRFQLEGLSGLLAEQQRKALEPLADDYRWFWHDGEWKPSRLPVSQRGHEEITPYAQLFSKELYLNQKDYVAVRKARERLGERIATSLRLTKGSTPRFVDWYATAIAGLSSKSSKYEKANERLKQGVLSGGDLDVMITMLMLVLYGSTETQGRSLFSMSTLMHSSIVFVDEVQDFSEVELFTLSMMADPKRSAVMIVGDRCQQLSKKGARNIARCFPRAQELEPLFLHRNFRQTEALVNFSLAVRKRIGGQVPNELPFWKVVPGELEMLECDDKDIMMDVLVRDIIENRDALSVAVISPTAKMAQQLFSRLEPDLNAQFIEANYADDGRDLTRVDIVHFTSPKPVKGLEFDVVYVPFWNRFNLDRPISADGAYVAISRAKSRLILLSDGQMNRTELWPDEGVKVIS